MRQHPNIAKFQKREMPVNYSDLVINQLGEIVKRSGAADLSQRESNLAKRVVEGYGVIWGSVNDRGEKFVKGCFAKSISDLGPGTNSAYHIKFRDEHGRACALFAELKEDDIGLYFKTVPLDKVSWCDDMLVQLTSGTINNFSIGFKHNWDKVEWDDGDDCLINLEARLFEISAVSIPSDIETYCVRSAEEFEYVEEDVEDFIIKLPRSVQFEARKIFTRCMSLSKSEPQEQTRTALKKRNGEPIETGKLDIKFLTQKLKEND